MESDEERCVVCWHNPRELNDEGVPLVDTRLHFTCKRHSEKVCRFCVSNPNMTVCPLCRSPRKELKLHPMFFLLQH